MTDLLIFEKKNVGSGLKFIIFYYRLCSLIS